MMPLLLELPSLCLSWQAPNMRMLSEAMLSEVAAAIVRNLAAWGSLRTEIVWALNGFDMERIASRKR